MDTLEEVWCGVLCDARKAEMKDLNGDTASIGARCRDMGNIETRNMGLGERHVLRRMSDAPVDTPCRPKRRRGRRKPR